MPVLLYLKLIANSIDDGFIIEDGKFRSLHHLCLVLKVIGISVLTIEDGSRSEIISLQLICKDLVDLSGVKIMRLPELKEISLHPEVDEKTRKVWEAEAINHHNRPKVLSIIGDFQETPATDEEEPAHEYHNQKGPRAAEEEPPAACSAMSVEAKLESNSTEPIRSGLVVNFAKGDFMPDTVQLQEVAPSATC
jgi:hypothetical protein